MREATRDWWLRLPEETDAASVLLVYIGSARTPPGARRFPAFGAKPDKLEVA